MPNCMWCDAPDAASYEHILPEALGCPEGFVLTQGVCRRCNNRHSRVDRALLQPYEIMTVHKGIPRKRGRPATVDGWANLYAKTQGGSANFFFNSESYPVEIPELGRKLAPATRANGLTCTRRVLPTGEHEVSIKQELRFSKAAVRGLFKVGLEAVAYYHGLARACEPWAEPTRRFVLEGRGTMTAYMMHDPSPAYQSYFSGTWERADREYPTIGFTILHLGFLIDFDPQNRDDEMFRSAAANENFGLHKLPNFPHRTAA